MKRRHLLTAFVASVGATTGCLGGDSGGDGDGDTGRDSDDPTASGTQAPTVERATTTGSDGTCAPSTAGSAAAGIESDGPVRDVEITPSVASLGFPDSITTFGDRDEQFAIATVEPPAASETARTTAASEPDQFSLVAGDASYDPGLDIGSYANRPWGRDEAYDGTDAGWLGFVLPKPLDADGAAITWPGGEQSLTDAAVERLTRPPTTFAVSSFGACESGDRLALTVENVGDVDGTFVGALNRIDSGIRPDRGVRLQVPAGESATWTTAVGDGGVSFRLNWRRDSAQAAIGNGTATGDQ